MIKTILKKKYNIIIILILVCSSYLVGCSNSTSNPDIEYYKKQVEELKLANSELSKIINNENIQSYAIEDVSNIQHVKEIDGTYYIVLRVKGKVQLWKYEEDFISTLLAEGIKINIEVRNQYLYCSVLKRTGLDGYTDEVLKFDSENNESVICKGKHVNISSSPDGKYFIIIDNQESDMAPTLKLLDENDKIIFDEIIGSELVNNLEPYGWNGSKFWAVFDYSGIRGGCVKFLVLDTEKFEYELLGNNPSFAFEFDLNIRTGWVCYSNHPILRDTYMYSDFMESKREVSLFLYNIYTDETIKIATSITKSFDPKWIDDYTFEYNNPVSDERILYKLKLK